MEASLPFWVIILIGCALLMMVILLVKLLSQKRMAERAAAKMLSAAEEAVAMSGLPVSPGTRLGDYQIEEKLYDGGMTITYLGKDQNGLPFLIKIPQPRHLENTEFIERFHREGEILRKLKNPHVVKLAENGALKDKGKEIPYMILEYIEGKDLGQVIRDEAPLEPEKALSIVKGIARALEVVHTEGVVHRNIKPSSIRITPEGNVKLLNFGIAKAVGIDTITKVGTAMGTALYMAPEAMSDEKLDLRADLYALGVIFYKLITGKEPYEVKTVQQLLALKMKEEPQDPCQLNPGLPSFMCDACLRLLKINRDERFDSARSLLSAIENIPLKGSE